MAKSANGSKSADGRGKPASARSATPAEGRPARDYAIAAVIAGVLFALVVAAVIAAIRTSAPSPDRTETLALLGRIRAIRAAIAPIAKRYTSANQSAPIEVTAFRDQLERAREVVVGINAIPIASAENFKFRDQIATGGATILDGLSAALDALQSDDATAATDAGTQVDEGVNLLDGAEQQLKEKAAARGWLR